MSEYRNFGMGVQTAKWQEVLCLIADAVERNDRSNYLERLLRNAPTSCSYLKRNVKYFEACGWVVRERRKNRKYLTLTSKGLEMAQSIRKQREIINESTHLMEIERR